METMSRAEPKHMCSWWWASHISPKSSKWLQENLTDMDSKVKLMIKLIEVDEDSFARRAEMYYKKRPELMKLVEEFYRAYRALAERYDHATGVIRHANKTMAEAFPNQVPILESVDGSIFGSSNDPDPYSPEMSDLVRAFWNPGELDNGAVGSKEAPFIKLAEGKVRPTLNFHNAKKSLSENDRLERSETDIKALKKALAKLEAEKEAGLAQYQQSFERLCSLECEVLRAQEDSRGFHERASKAETEVQSLKESLCRLEGEREASLSQYQQCLNMISSLENYVSHAQVDAEKEAWVLNEELAQLRNEKEARLAKYMEALESIANLENKLLIAEDKASLASERADNAEKEVVALKEALSSLTSEFKQCLEKTARLENEMKGAEEQCLLLERSNKSMKTELDSVLFKMGLQNEELAEKQMEVGRLWTCIQEERVRVVEAETAFKSLQGLHSRTQEDLRSVAAELQKRVLLLKEMEVHNQKLQGEVQKFEEENNSLNELNMSSSVLIKNMHDEILSLKEGNESEISVLLEKLDVMEKLSEKNALLESSLLELSVELEDARAKVKSLEDSLFDANVELEALRSNSRILEDSFRLLNDEKSILVNERHALELKLKELGEKHAGLEITYHGMEKERVSVLRLVDDLRGSLDAGKKEHDNSTQLSQLQMAEMESKICVVQELVEQTRGQLGEELDKAANAQFEIFILRNTLQDLRETNCSLLNKCEKLLEASTLSEKLISELENENNEQKEEVGFLSDQIMRLRSGMFQLLKVLEVDLDHVFEDNIDGDQMVLHRILGKLDDTRRSLFSAQDENQKLVIEKSVLLTLLGQLKQELADFKTLIDSLQKEFGKRNDQLTSLQGNMLKLLQSNEKLLLRVREGNHKEELLASEMESLREKLREMQGVCEDLEKENSRILEENRSLSSENSCLIVEAVTLDTLSLVFKNGVVERSEAIQQLFGDNRVLEDKAMIMDGMLGEYQTENMRLKASLEKYDDELKEVKTTHCQLEAMVKMLHSDLKKGKEEAELWETVAGTTFVELQTSSVRETVYIQKLSELTKEYQYLVDKNYSDVLEAVQLKERVGSLEGENSQIKSQWVGYVLAMATLRDAVTSLERHVMQSEVDNDDEEDASSGGSSDLQDIVVKIKAVDDKVKETKRCFPSEAMEEQLNKTSDPQEADGELGMKDIMLDQASEASSRMNNRNTWHNNADSDDQIVELWETEDKAVKKHNSEHELHSSEMPVEKELRVDSLDLSKRYTELDEAETNKKLLERLSSDTQNLTNLQTIIHDLKQKVVIITESSNTTKGKEAEYSGLNDQLEEAERAITKLLDVNSKLLKHVEDCSINSPMWPTSSPITDPSEFEESELRRRKVSEQARRCSEKIGRLQVEVQMIQFLLLKLDSGNTIGRSSETRILERDRKVPLRDYLYGSEARTRQRRRKARFCACVKPPTSGD